MQFYNTTEQFGWIAILLHWLMAISILGLFGLGWYMVELDYYDTLYHKLPAIHKSVGVILALVFVLRLLWTLINLTPGPVAGVSDFEQKLARWLHRVFYGLIAVILMSGYLISTADGLNIPVFGFFELPATRINLPAQEDNAGLVHQYSAYCLIVLVILHAGAALKHHFLNRDRTLRRMIGLDH